MAKDMCHDGGFQGNFTNHSPRATSATTLFDAGVSEAIIQKRSRHKSMSVVRKYERITLEQDLATSNILGKAGEAFASTSGAHEDNFDPESAFSEEDFKTLEDIIC